MRTRIAASASQLIAADLRELASVVAQIEIQCDRYPEAFGQLAGR